MILILIWQLKLLSLTAEYCPFVRLSIFQKLALFIQMFYRNGFLDFLICLIFKGFLRIWRFWTQYFKMDILLLILLYWQNYFRLTLVIWFLQKSTNLNEFENKNLNAFSYVIFSKSIFFKKVAQSFTGLSAK